MELNTYEQEVKRTVEHLIKSGSAYELEELDKIYSTELKIVMINENSQVITFNREENMALFAAKRRAGDAPLDTYADFNYVEASESFGHVIVTRKMALGDRVDKIIFSLYLKKIDTVWQVYRETAFIQPA